MGKRLFRAMVLVAGISSMFGWAAGRSRAMPAEQTAPTQPAAAKTATKPATKPAGPPDATAPKTAAPSDQSWAEVLEKNPDPKVVTDPDLLQRIAATGLPWRVRDKASGIEMLLVPPGKFMMGMSPGDEEGVAMEKFLAEKYPEYKYSERPAHEVTITKPFYLGRTEVTQAQWLKVMQNNPSGFRKPGDANGAEGQKADPELDKPVERVSWEDCQVFCDKTGLQFPTEAQWEYAARAGVVKPRYGDIEQIAWSTENADEKTHPVGQKAANPLGFHDMIGNVWEWCSDWYQGDYYTACAAGVADPAGPAQSPNKGRVLRGGSWENRSNGCRVSMRRYFRPTQVINYLGFRAARTP